MTHLTKQVEIKQISKVESSNTKGWHLKLFEKSVLKQAKLREIQAAIGPIDSEVCLDLGSDNGVVSYYLRNMGGHWHSADLTEETVSSIRSLVGENVFLFDECKFPYPDQFFDLIVIVDMLEHVKNDSSFARELARVIKPKGRLIINAPNLKSFSLLRKVRHFIGQSDEAHGHLRPGYGTIQLNSLFDSRFQLIFTKTYSRFFSEFIDTAIVAAYTLLSKKNQTNKDLVKNERENEVSKGLVMTEESMKKFEKSFRIYSIVYPIVLMLSKLDLLISFIPGFMRLSVLRRIDKVGDCS